MGIKKYMSNRITAKLINYTGASTAEFGARICYDNIDLIKETVDWYYLNKILNMYKHESVFEHIVFQFMLEMPRMVLQELSRHRIISASVKSTRYTLKPLIRMYDLSATWEMFKYIINNSYLNKNQAKYLVSMIELDTDFTNKKLSMVNRTEALKKYLPESWFTKGIYTINFRSLKNLLTLRLDQKALSYFQQLSKEIVKELPNGIKYLLSDILGECDYSMDEMTEPSINFQEKEILNYLKDKWFPPESPRDVLGCS